MKINTLVLLVFVALTSCGNPTNTDTAKATIETEMTKQLRHVVMFKFKEEAKPADIQKVEAAFVGLSSKIKEIKDLEWGLNNSPEDLNKGFTHCFLVTFDSEADRAVYLPHPAHMAFVDVLGPHLDDVMVMDYWAK